MKLDNTRHSQQDERMLAAEGKIKSPKPYGDAPSGDAPSGETPHRERRPIGSSLQCLTIFVIELQKIPSRPFQSVQKPLTCETSVLRLV